MNLFAKKLLVSVSISWKRSEIERVEPKKETEMDNPKARNQENRIAMLCENMDQNITIRCVIVIVVNYNI